MSLTLSTEDCLTALVERGGSWQNSGNELGEPSGFNKPTPGYVYFVFCPSTGLIKIGTTQYPTKRVEQLAKSENAETRLICFVPGNKEAESFIHSFLEGSRERGEWFRQTGRVLNLIRHVLQNGQFPQSISYALKAQRMAGVAINIASNARFDAQKDIKEMSARAAPVSLDALLREVDEAKQITGEAR